MECAQVEKNCQRETSTNEPYKEVGMYNVPRDCIVTEAMSVHKLLINSIIVSPQVVNGCKCRIRARR